MKILLIGGGGREHAIARSIIASPLCKELLAAPGNAGIARYARCFPHVKATDIPGILDLVKAEAPDYVIVAPDDPLALGLVDELDALGVKSFGPNKSAARMESSKIFSKNLMKKYGIPTAAYEIFRSAEAALTYIETCPLPTVIKADGLALGKGVIIADDREDAKRAITAMMNDNSFGESGKNIVVEEFMHGSEVTLLCFLDGETIVPMLPSQDHKRALDGDRGLNTGGMGAICPSPLYTPEIAARVNKEILLPTTAALKSEGIVFKGVLYVGLMLTPDGPKVVEYNARFGDPEAQVVLPLLKTDLLPLMLAVTDGRLKDIHMRWSNNAACCVVIASGGYPEAYKTGYPISGVDSADDLIFHAGTREENGELRTNGGRVLGIARIGSTLPEAIESAYAAAKAITFKDAHMRTDIGRSSS